MMRKRRRFNIPDYPVEFEVVDIELEAIDQEFKRLDRIFAQLNTEASQGKYISSIIKFSRMLPDIISLAKRIPELERKIDSLSR